MNEDVTHSTISKRVILNLYLPSFLTPRSGKDEEGGVGAVEVLEVVEGRDGCDR